MKLSMMAISWISRGLGLLALLPALFPNFFLRIFPGAEPRHFQASLYGGVVFFVIGAVLYQIARYREKQLRRSQAADDI